MGALPSENVIQCFCWVGLGDSIHIWMVPLQLEVTCGPSALSLSSPWWEVTWGSFHPLWKPRSYMSVANRTLVATGVVAAVQAAVSDRVAHSLYLLLKHCYHHEGLLVGLTMANIPSHESCFTAVNSSYVWQLATANPEWGSGQGALASTCLHSPSGWADGYSSQRHSLRESRMSLPRHSSVASSHWPLLGSLQIWYTS